MATNLGMSSEVLQHSISMPEDCDQNEVNSNNTLEVMVFLMDESSVCLKLKANEMSSLTANDVLNEVCKKKTEKINFNFNPRFKELFSIWVTSPYLEVQLQPKHKPFCVLAKWDQLLKKHGPPELINDPTLIEKDEPTLSFQRNVFCKPSLEKVITEADIGALYLLYCESKLNVLDGRYPKIGDSFESLAAYQAAIDLFENSNTEYNVEYFRQNLKEYIPFNYKANDGNKFNGLIRTLSRSNSSIRLSQRIHQKYKKISKDLPLYELLRSYLEICWEFPCYGSAYFSAQIERPIKSKMDSFVNHFDLEVWVAINETGIYVISKEEPELLLSVDCADLIWAVGCPESSNPNCIPCIYIQIPDDENENEILQIFSRQYRLIGSLLTSFINESKKTNSRNNSITNSTRNSSRDSDDVIDGPMPVSEPKPKPLCRQISVNSKVYKKDRLSFAKFDRNGQVLNKTGSWVRSKK